MKSSKVIPVTRCWMVSMASSMCSNRFLSLIGSLIYQNLVVFNTFSGKGCQCSVNNQVNGPTQHSFQISPHTKELQTDRLSMVKYNQYIDIALESLFPSCEGAEEPCLQDGLRLEILGYLLCYCFSAHSKRVNLATKIRIILETTKEIAGNVVQEGKTSGCFLRLITPVRDKIRITGTLR